MLSHDSQVRAAEIAKLVAEDWKALSNEERLPFEQQASEDKARYEREKAQYAGPWRVAQTKAKDAPKRPISAFLAYSNERRKQVARANPALSNGDVSGTLAQMWKREDASVRKLYEERQASRMATFRQDRDEFIEKTKQAEILKYRTETARDTDSDPGINVSSPISASSKVPTTTERRVVRKKKARKPSGDTGTTLRLPTTGSDDGSGGSDSTTNQIEQLELIDPREIFHTMKAGKDVFFSMKSSFTPLTKTDTEGYLAAAAALYEPLEY